MENNMYFRLTPYCFVVVGGDKPSICDIHRGAYRFISKELGYVLTEMKFCTIGEIREAFEENEQPQVESWFKFLLKNGFGYFTASTDDESAAA